MMNVATAAVYGPLSLDAAMGEDAILVRQPITRDRWMELVEQIAEIEELIAEIHDENDMDSLESATTLGLLTNALRQKRALLKVIDVG